MIDKTRLLQDLREHVSSDLQALIRRQQDTQEGATHEENRSEHAKDTRATEQSYLARGLATRVHEMRKTATNLEKIELVNFDSRDPIGLTALVVLQEIDTQIVLKEIIKVINWNFYIQIFIMIKHQPQFFGLNCRLN